MFSYKLRMQPKGNLMCHTSRHSPDVKLRPACDKLSPPPLPFLIVFFFFLFLSCTTTEGGLQAETFYMQFFFFCRAVHTSQKNLFHFVQVLPDLPHFSHCKQQKLRWQPGYNETQKDVLADLILSRVVLTCSHPAEIYLLNRFIYYAL